MDRIIYGIFVAGGSGTRMGSSLPKQFMDLGGKPVLQRTIDRFREVFPGIKVITVLPKSHFDTWKRLCDATQFICPQILVEGGLTRFHSVQNALAKVPDGALVFIHDGVRPLVSPQLLRKMADAMGECGALIPVVPVVDTLRSRKKGEPAPDRSSVEAVQTPQVFRSELIKKAYTQAYDVSFTDDASVAEAAGIPVSTIEGERFNLKLTTPDDLVLAEAILSLDL